MIGPTENFAEALWQGVRIQKRKGGNRGGETIVAVEH